MKKYSAWLAALVLVWLVLTCVFLILAPDRVPVHFDINGEVDRWGSKFEFLLFPGIGIAILCVRLFGDKLGLKKAAGDNEKTAAVTMIGTMVLLIVLSGYFMWKALDPATVTEGLDRLALRSTMILMMVLFIFLGNLMPKLKRNSAFGLRTKWSMYNDTCWQKSQRFGGYVLIATGVLGLMLCAVLPDAWVIWCCLGLLPVGIVSSLVGSFRIYKMEKEKETSENE